MWFMYGVNTNRNAGVKIKNVAGLHFFLLVKASAAAAAAAAASVFNFSSLCSKKSLYSSAERLKRRREEEREREGEGKLYLVT